MPPAPIRILIVDDHPLVRFGLRSLLERNGEFKVAGEGSDGYEAIKLATLHSPDVVLLDVAMPALTGPTGLSTSGTNFHPQA